GTGGTGGTAGDDDGKSRAPLFVLGAVFLVWLFTGVFQVGAAEKGVIQRFGKYVGTRGPGLGMHLPWPIETVRKVNVASINSIDYKSRMLTADVNLVEIHVAVQFRYSDPLAVLFKVRDPEGTLQEISESAIREIVGQSKLDDVLVGSRQQITESTRDLIQRTLDTYESGIVVSTVNLVDVQVPEAVAASQRDANKAIEDRDRFSKEAQAYANDILPKALGTAQRTEQDAEAYKSKIVAQAEGEASRFSQLATAYAVAPEVTRQRLYIETMEYVLAHSRKVILDAKGAGNMIYLPLDKMLERSGSRSTAEQAGGATRLPEMDTVTVDGRARGDR
ncbi:MAG: FtsH protease activity modulator HflK, partial [Steroidobacteraceae bacterium]